MSRNICYFGISIRVIIVTSHKGCVSRNEDLQGAMNEKQGSHPTRDVRVEIQFIKKIVKSLDIFVKKSEEKCLKCCKKVLTAFMPYSIMRLVDDVGS